SWSLNNLLPYFLITIPVDWSNKINYSTSTNNSALLFCKKKKKIKAREYTKEVLANSPTTQGNFP
ncbi:hypothetical protein RFF58_11130, partial [Streptococcus ruminantium]|nr:hypothetical protein [Streptococcus ruminantium]